MTETRTMRTPLEIARDRLGQAQSAIAKVLPAANKHGQYEMAADLTKMMVTLSGHSSALAKLIYTKNAPLPVPHEANEPPLPLVREESLVATVIEHHGTMLSDGTVVGARTETYEVDLPRVPLVAHDDVPPFDGRP